MWFVHNIILNQGLKAFDLPEKVFPTNLPSFNSKLAMLYYDHI